MKNQKTDRTSENVEIRKQIVELLKGRTYSEAKGILEHSLKVVEDSLFLQ